MIEEDMVCESGTRRLRRPSFLIGVILGVGLSSLTCELFLTLYTDDVSTSVSSGRSPRDLSSQLLRGDSDPFSGPEVRHLGLKLRASKDGDEEDLETDEETEATVVDHFDLISPEELLPEHRTSRMLGARRLVYVGVLTDNNNMEEALPASQLTWATSLPAVQFYHPASPFSKKDTSGEQVLPAAVPLHDIEPGEAYSALHALSALHHVCDNFREDYHWFALIRDSTYIHSTSLLKTLSKLPPSSHVLIGSLSGTSGHCSQDDGLVLSSRLLSRMCSQLKRCTQSPDMAVAESPDMMLSYCVASLGVACTDSIQVNKAFHVNTKEIKDPTPSSVFLGPVTSLDDVYRLHLHFTDLQIQRTQNEIFRLGRELAHTQEILPPEGLNVGQNVLNSESANQSQTFYQFIDESGHMYLDTCKVKKDDVKGQGSAYEMAKELAVKEIGEAANKMQSFAYRVLKPNIGIEYQFYFMSSGQRINQRGVPLKEELVYHVSVLQPYGELKVISKTTRPLQLLHLVVVVPQSLLIFKAFLNTYERECLNGHKHPRCHVLFVLYRHSKYAYSAGQETLQDILDELKRKYPDALIQLSIVSGEAYTLARTIQMSESAFGSESLLAFLPADINFSQDFLHRCQLNTEYTRQAYFPIPFQQFESKDSSSSFLNPATEPGFWANSDYDAFCAYTADLQGLDVLPQSSRHLYEELKVQARSVAFQPVDPLQVFRAPDPALVRTKKLCNFENSNTKSIDRCRKEIQYRNLL